MKSSLSFILLSIALTAMSQSSKISYEAFFSFDDTSGSEFLTNSNNVGFAVNYTEFNYTTGVTIKRSLTEKLTLVSGLTYSNQEVSKYFICPVCDITGDVYHSRRIKVICRFQ